MQENLIRRYVFFKAANVAGALYFGGYSPAVVAVVPAAMFGRVYFGAHWIGDTIAGAFLGALSSWIVFIFSSF